MTLLATLLPLLLAKVRAQQDTLCIAYALSTLRTVNSSEDRKGHQCLRRHNSSQRQIDLAGEVGTGHLHLISIMGQEYLELADSQLITPIYVPLRNNEMHERVVCARSRLPKAWPAKTCWSALT